MTRLFVLGLLLVILRLAVKNFTGQLKTALSGGDGPPRPTAPRAVAEALVPCARCGTYVASSRALAGAGEGDLYCSETCRLDRSSPAAGTAGRS